MRKALFLLLFVVYFAGYPAIQFSTRHYFHLEFLSWWALGFLLQTAFSAIIMITRKNGRQLLREQLGRPQDWWARAVRLIGFGGGAILLLSGSLWLLRTYQHGHVVQLIHTHIAADKEVLSSNQTTLENGRLLIHSPSVGAPLKQRPAGHEPVSTEYLAVEFDPARCHATKIALTIRYQAKKRHHDFSRGLTVDLSDEDTGPAYFFFPVFSFSAWTPSIFQGIEIDQQQAECFQALYRVEDPSQFPILLNLTLPPNWEQAQLYHTLVE